MHHAAVGWHGFLSALFVREWWHTLDALGMSWHGVLYYFPSWLLLSSLDSAASVFYMGVGHHWSSSNLL